MQPPLLQHWHQATKHTSGCCSYVSLRLLGSGAEDAVVEHARAWVRILLLLLILLLVVASAFLHGILYTTASAAPASNRSI